MKPISLFTGFLTVGFWTLASRMLGFVREIMLLSLIGPGPVMDAFAAEDQASTWQIVKNGLRG